MLEGISGLVTAILTGLGTLIPAYLLHRREVMKLRSQVEEKKQAVKKERYATQVLDRWLDMHYLNRIKAASEKIFEQTKADRFLILIGFNGTSDFRYVSVIFEEQNWHEADEEAINKYQRISVDKTYQRMLKKAEAGPELYVELNVMEMEECLLKRFYELEGVKHSQIRFLARDTIDELNDVVIFSSVATHNPQPFDRLETTYIQAQYESVIKPTLHNIMK